jgi:iron uptake system EfeUOB component EfeO/EfeM
MLSAVRTRRLLSAAAVGAALVTSLAACGSGGGQPAGLITVSSNQCGGQWQLSAPGWHTFEINNQSTGGGEVDLIDPASGAVYDEIVNLGPGTTTPMALDVGSGRYAFLCLFDDFNPLTGATVTVAGHAAGAKAILPVTYNDLIPLAKKYQAYTEAGLKVLARETATVTADVRSGHLAAAQHDWLTAHLTFETLGAAYDAFGHFDDEIEGRADAVGVNSPKWGGFYRLEYGLWHGQSATELTPVAQALSDAVAALLASWPAQQIALINIGLRTHEIMENALQFQLTGHDDYGSGTTLATVLANIAGDRVLLSLLHPLLAPRYPGLPSVYSELTLLQSLLEKQHLPNGRWVPVSALTVSARQAIDAACGQLVQDLSPIASIAEPRNTAHAF